MSELYSVYKRPAAWLAIAASSIALGACGENHYGDQPAIPPCFDQPVRTPMSPEPKPPRIPSAKLPYDKFRAAIKRYDKKFKAYERALLGETVDPLKMNMLGGYAQDDPIYKPGLESKVESSLVQLETSESRGSGFLTKDSEGKEVVITAAHVVGSVKLKYLKITTENGKSTHATGGCYVYEDGDGKRAKLKEEKPVRYDVAVLTLARELGHKTLELSNRATKRGEWAYFMNYQATHEPGYPASYTGLTVTSSNNMEEGFNIITGAHVLETPITVREADNNTLQPGASGGPVIGPDNKVAGISAGGTKEELYLGPGFLKDLYNVRFNGVKYGSENGFVPNSAEVVPACFLRKVLNSTRHDQLASQK